MPKEYILNETFTIKVKTSLEDEDVPTRETLKFLLKEDLQDLGYDVEFID